MKLHCKVKNEQVINLQITQQLKTKSINVMPGQLFCRQCKAKFLLETEIYCIDDEDKGQSVTDTDDEFNECQTTRKQLQSIAISSVSLHVVPKYSRITNAKIKLEKIMKTIKSNISETCKVQPDCWGDLQSDFYDKYDMKEKANELVRLHEAMQEKLKIASYSK